MNRRQFLAGLLASTALGQAPKPFVVSFDNFEWKIPEITAQNWRYKVFIPDWVGTRETPDIKWREICDEEFYKTKD
jgi:hypothetical protein